MPSQQRHFHQKPRPDLPTTVIRKATKYEVRPIHTMHMKKVSIRNFGYFLQSGIVNHNTSVIGQRAKNAIRPVSAERFHGVSANPITNFFLKVVTIALCMCNVEWLTTIFFINFLQFSCWNKFFSRVSFFVQERSNFSHFTVWSHFGFSF